MKAFTHLKQELNEGSLHHELKELLENIDESQIISESLSEYLVEKLKI